MEPAQAAAELQLRFLAGTPRVQAPRGRSGPAPQAGRGRGAAGRASPGGAGDHGGGGCQRSAGPYRQSAGTELDALPRGGRDRNILSQLPVAALSRDRKSTRLNSSHVAISYAVFCLKKKKDKKD